MILFCLKFKKCGEWSKAVLCLILRGLVLLCFTLSVFTEPVSAQSDSADQNTLVQHIERLRRDLDDILRYVYRDNDAVKALEPSRSAESAGNPPRPAEAAGNPRLQRQILEIHEQIRELTGNIERFQHSIRMINERLDKLVADVDVRLQALEGGKPIADSGQPVQSSRQLVTPLSSNEAGTAVVSSDGASGVQVELAPGQRSLGRISGDELASVQEGQPVPPSATSQQVKPIVLENKSPPSAAPAPRGVSSSVASVARSLNSDELPEGTARQQYKYAFGKLKTRNYVEAENALRIFVDRHPDDPLAGNAMYWMGETYYVRKQYSEAARIFLDAYQRFPKGNKAPDNLFKLAKSLSQIGEDKFACTTYVELVKTFPSANQRILSGARSDMMRLGCG
jgi:tol-pal system protein YbgF